MFCEALQNEEEVYQAYLLYASLHGLSTDEKDVRERISNYLLKNQPDELIDAAVLAFSEDRILAPPDIILEHWGKSRVYELEPIPTGGWRHQVSESWIDAGCRFSSERPVKLSHFWTKLETDSLPDDVGVGSRCSFRLADEGNVHVVHRQRDRLGVIPQPLANEILSTVEQDIHYLLLIDMAHIQQCRLLVTRALADVSLTDVVDYAANAFTAPRNKC